MAASRTHRTTPLLSVGILGCACFLSALLVKPAFILNRHQGVGPKPARTVVRGFKEDFEAWRTSLTPEERAMVQKQAQGEFNKKFRKSDEFKKDLPKEKVEAFSKILGKFFDNEANDYKKELEMKTPDYDSLFERRNNKFDFSLKPVVVEIDRDADRRYRWALIKIAAAEAKGEKFPNSSPMNEIHAFPNRDEKEHEFSVKMVNYLKDAANDADCPEDFKPAIAELVEKGVPPAGEKFDIILPQVLVVQFNHMRDQIQEIAASYQNKTDAEFAELEKEMPNIATKVMQQLTKTWIEARDEIQANADHSKEWFKSQNEERYKTKADVMKAVWEVLPKLTGSSVPPIDEELLADLEQQPAVEEGEYRHSWGIADKLYKSEAIDAFGMKYLLGIFETKDEALKAFNDWNQEYEKARADLKAGMEQWGKSEQARLDKDTAGQERIKAILSEQRGR